ncbi:Methyltransferase domain protein [Cesiribacter andamanensis AMV16]|uniref:Methyltransferase domain protein n=2 Tax=Cesiribacter TaxID=1133570 RepID=M7N7N0_9BACT|nr:class I SAM-dependent methyltransferase [Cesiribacter andamanensis]EMR03236.1 Methyltransferase domain protein [Cesiribacter andamanensis AMV16]
MLQKAKEKISAPNVHFFQADISEEWGFARQGGYDLVSVSLVLEHLPALEPVFQKAAAALQPGGRLYVGELHPFKQYSGSKARFDAAEGTQVLSCFTHHVSDFTEAARQAGLELLVLREYFDQEDRAGLPRILALLFRKP